HRTDEPVTSIPRGRSHKVRSGGAVGLQHALLRTHVGGCERLVGSERVLLLWSFVQKRQLRGEADLEFLLLELNSHAHPFVAWSWAAVPAPCNPLRLGTNRTVGTCCR